MSTPSLTNSPLCATETARLLIELAEMHYKESSGAECSRWQSDIGYAKSYGRLPPPPSAFKNLAPILVPMQAIFESLHVALINNPNGLLNLQSLKSEQDAQKRTWEQVVSGESAEFNKMIEQIVDRRIQSHEEKMEVGVQSSLELVEAARQELKIASTPAQKIKIFQRAMEDLKKAGSAPHLDRFLIGKLIEQVGELGLDLVSEK